MYIVLKDLFCFIYTAVIILRCEQIVNFVVFTGEAPFGDLWTTNLFQDAKENCIDDGYKNNNAN